MRLGVARNRIALGAQLGKQPEEISDMMDILKLDESERELVLKNHLSIRHARTNRPETGIISWDQDRIRPENRSGSSNTLFEGSFP